MEVARLRGCDWTYSNSFGGADVASMIAEGALSDVADALGYSDFEAYNLATIHQPGEVRRRLAQL